MADSRAQIRQFLATPVPPSGTIAWGEWQAHCDALDDSAVPALIDALRHSGLAEQEASLLCLRRHGWEAWAEGYWEHLTYRVRRQGDAEWQHIRPDVTE